MSFKELLTNSGWSVGFVGIWNTESFLFNGEWDKHRLCLYKIEFCWVSRSELLLGPILGKCILAVRISASSLCWGHFLTIFIKRNPAYLSPVYWLLYLESWNHKLLVLKGTLKAIYQVPWIYNTWASFIIILSNSCLASPEILPIIWHSCFLKSNPFSLAFTSMSQEL